MKKDFVVVTPKANVLWNVEKYENIWKDETPIYFDWNHLNTEKIIQRLILIIFVSVQFFKVIDTYH